MKKLLSLVLALLLALSFAGCSGSTAMTEANVTATVDQAFSALKDFNTKKYLFFSAIVLIVWLAAYQMVLPFGTWVAYSLLQLPVGENLGRN